MAANSRRWLRNKPRLLRNKRRLLINKPGWLRIKRRLLRVRGVCCETNAVIFASRHDLFASRLIFAGGKKRKSATIWHSLFAQHVTGMMFNAKRSIHQNVWHRCGTIKVSWGNLRHCRCRNSGDKPRRWQHLDAKVKSKKKSDLHLKNPLNPHPSGWRSGTCRGGELRMTPRMKSGICGTVVISTCRMISES